MTAAVNFDLEQYAAYSGRWIYPPHMYPRSDLWMNSMGNFATPFSGFWIVESAHEPDAFRKWEGERIVMRRLGGKGNCFITGADWVLRFWVRLAA